MGFTPGTWYVRKPDGRYKRAVVTAPGDRSICAVNNPGDAGLISAAPEMLFITRLIAAFPIPAENAPEDTLIFGIDGHYITVGDVRHARATLQKIGEIA